MNLFPDLPEPGPDPFEGMGNDARRTARARQWIAAGRNPGTLFEVHPNAATERTGPGLRCGDCKSLRRRYGWFKCEKTKLRNDVISDGPDMRRWWPACALFEQKD